MPNGLPLTGVLRQQTAENDGSIRLSCYAPSVSVGTVNVPYAVNGTYRAIIRQDGVVAANWLLGALGGVIRVPYGSSVTVDFTSTRWFVLVCNGAGSVVQPPPADAAISEWDGGCDFGVTTTDRTASFELPPSAP